MPPEGTVDYCQNYTESQCESPFQAEVQPHVREKSDASSQTECFSPVGSASDASYESPSLEAVQPASDASVGSESQPPCRNDPPMSIEEEVRSTVDMFRKVADGAESIDHVMEEIDNDRKAMGVGSRKERHYSSLINQHLIHEQLLPEISFLYVKDNFSQMAKGGKVTESSYAKYRAEDIDKMSPVDKLLSRYFINSLHDSMPSFFGMQYFNLKELDTHIEWARWQRIKTAEKHSDMKEVISFLTEDDGKKFDLLSDKDAGGITRKSIKRADDKLDTEDRNMLRKLRKVFHELSLGDKVLKKAEMDYRSKLLLDYKPDLGFD